MHSVCCFQKRDLIDCNKMQKYYSNLIILESAKRKVSSVKVEDGRLALSLIHQVMLLVVVNLLEKLWYTLNRQIAPNMLLTWY